MKKPKYTTAPTTHEDELYNNGQWPIAGMDEAGRGPLAGPVVACAVILPHGFIIEGVNDSKKISQKRREKLAESIKEVALCYAFGIVDVDEIERINILQATLLAMQIAVNNLTIAPAITLIDGTTRPELSCTSVCIPKGDSESHLIAAASILAKVERDNIMQELHNKYPQYGFEAHKGYGTVAHREALRLYGLCPHHRKSFCHVEKL